MFDWRLQKRPWGTVNTLSTEQGTNLFIYDKLLLSRLYVVPPCLIAIKCNRPRYVQCETDPLRTLIVSFTLIRLLMMTNQFLMEELMEVVDVGISFIVCLWVCVRHITATFLPVLSTTGLHNSFAFQKKLSVPL